MLDKLAAYGFVGTIRLLRDLVFTKILFPQARIIRWPFYIRNYGKIDIGKNFTTGVGLRIDCVSADAELIIGNDVQINDYCHIGVKDRVRIGNNVLIASKVMIIDHNHGLIAQSCECSRPDVPPILRPLESSEILISDNVWIGEGVLLLPGVSIGSGTIVGAGSVVTKDIPANSLAVGNPAKVIKNYDFNLSIWSSPMEISG